MSLKLITAASSLAVTLAEAKAHLRVDASDEDTLITSLITAATETAEQITGRAIMPQTWQMWADTFDDEIELTRVPVASVTSVSYVDDAGATTTLTSGTHYRLITDDFSPARIVPAYGYTWPVPRVMDDAVTVVYVAGYANAAAVPQPIKNWILLAIGTMYENREGEVVTGSARTAVTQLKFADGLLDRYKVWNL